MMSSSLSSSPASTTCAIPRPPCLACVTRPSSPLPRPRALCRPCPGPSPRPCRLLATLPCRCRGTCAARDPGLPSLCPGLVVLGSPRALCTRPPHTLPWSGTRLWAWGAGCRAGPALAGAAAPGVRTTRRTPPRSRRGGRRTEAPAPRGPAAAVGSVSDANHSNATPAPRITDRWVTTVLTTALVQKGSSKPNANPPGAAFFFSGT